MACSAARENCSMMAPQTPGGRPVSASRELTVDDDADAIGPA
jgi:hypothetical protein